MMCSSCGRDYPSHAKFCPYCGGGTAKTEAGESKGGGMLKYAIILVVIVASAFYGYKAYAQRQFQKDVASISVDLASLAVETERIVDEINKAWRDAIFSEDKKGDFDMAIVGVRYERREDISRIKTSISEIGNRIKGIDPPSGKEDDYKRLKEIYLLFNKYTDMAGTPSGSLQTFSQQNSELTVEIKSAVKELEMML